MVLRADIEIAAKQTAEQTEENLRVQLAYLYRIFKHFGWGDLIVTHLSVRVPSEEALLIIPFGLSFDEITPRNLVKVGFDGDIIESAAGHIINKNGTTVHRAVYRQSPEVNCILHTHSLYGTAVSCLKEGLMYLDQLGMMFYDRVAYHDFETLFIHDNEQDHLVADLGDKNCMILHNHGLLTVGKSVAEAFWFHYYLEQACKLQITTMSAGGEIKLASDETIQQTAARYDGWRDQNDEGQIGDSELLFEAAKRLVKVDW